MIPRFAEQTLRAKLATSPAVVLLGPRQVGKTTTARGLAQNSRVPQFEVKNRCFLTEELE